MLRFRMQSCVERIQDVACGDDALVVFGIMQALHNRRNDVAASAPYCALDSTDPRTPEPWILAAPLANGKIQFAPSDFLCLLNGASNLRILDLSRPPLLRSAAPVDLDVVESPLGELQEVLVLMPL